MEATEIVKLAAAGNVSEFHANIQDTVLAKLRDRIDTYKQEICVNVSDANDD